MAAPRLYDIADYTDADLLEVLDLMRPSDRELEAKIQQNIARYRAIDSDDGRAMARMMEDIYDHFFGDEADDEEAGREGFAAMDGGAAPPAQTSQGAPLATGLDAGVVHTANFDYITGNVNPLLKTTVTRMVSIDSASREDIDSSCATNYTFNLSDTLHNVVSMRLTAVQIPCAWYTISTTFGSNFFYINGVSPGIDREEYSIKVSVNAGNFATVALLVAAVNASMAAAFATSFPDILYGDTSISYSEGSTLTATSTLKTTFTLGFRQIYTESAYYLDFPAASWTSPQAASNTGGEFSSIPGFLGFNRKTYAPTCIYSAYSAGYTIAGNNALTYKLTALNNFITIITYAGPAAYSAATSTVYETIVVTSSLAVTSASNSGYYTMNALITNFNAQLKACAKLVNAGLAAESVSDINAATPFAVALRLRVNRRTTTNAEGLKTVVVFPVGATGDQPIWCGATSCFGFAAQTNEMSDIASETPNYFTRYMVSSSPYARLKCTKTGYGAGDSTANDMQFSIPNSGSAGYLMGELHDAISAGMTALKAQQTAAEKGFFCNLAMLDFSVAPAPTITVDINRTFSASSFALDITGSFLASSSTANGGNGICNLTVGDLSITTTYTSIFAASVGGYPITASSNVIVLSGAADETAGLAKHTVLLPVPASNNYPSIAEMQAAFNAAMAAAENNPTPQGVYMRGTSLSLTQSTTKDNKIICVLTVVLSASLTESDYALQLYDPAANSAEGDESWSETSQVWYSETNVWFQSLHFAAAAYSLGETGAAGYLDGNYATVAAVSDILSNELYLTSENNYFYVRALYDASGGAYTSSEANDYLVQIDTALYPVNNYYTSLSIRAAIQSAFDAVPDLAGTTISIDLSSFITTIRLCVNRVFSGVDYALLFYDNTSFTKCIPNSNTAVSSVAIDSTLGWILGFRDSVQYVLSPNNVSTSINSEEFTYYVGFISSNFTSNRSARRAVLVADTPASVDIYNYFLVCLDDFSMNHLTNGLVTIGAQDISTPLPSYANRTTRRCARDASNNNTYFVGGSPDQVTGNQLTANQVYSANQILANKRANNTSMRNYATGLLTNNALCLVPITFKNVSSGTTYTDTGSFLQAQLRTYFGPVNISRMSVQLLTNNGRVLDLNHANWSFTLTVDQLYSSNST